MIIIIRTCMSVHTHDEMEVHYIDTYDASE